LRVFKTINCGYFNEPITVKHNYKYCSVIVNWGTGK
jgi:hypothetical protein